MVDFRSMIRFVPNILTVTRLLSLPLFVWLYIEESPGTAWWSGVVLVIAALTDLADGRIARHYHVESTFGRVVDPLVDRLFFITLLLTLSYCGTLPWWATLPLIARDAVLLAGGALLYRSRQEKPRILAEGRAANLILICGIGFFVMEWPLAWLLYAVGAGMYLYAGGHYLVRAYRERPGSPEAAAGD